LNKKRDSYVISKTDCLEGALFHPDQTKKRSHNPTTASTMAAEQSQGFGVATTMAAVLGTMVAMVAGMISLQEPLKEKDKVVPGRYFPCPTTEPSKLAYEQFVSVYTPTWMFLFGIVVVFQLYEDFTAISYLQVCGGLALPFLLQPLVLPTGGFDSPDAKRPLSERYSFKANLWIAVYSFIGNYWYTHCKFFRLLLWVFCLFVRSFVCLLFSLVLYNTSLTVLLLCPFWHSGTTTNHATFILDFYSVLKAQYTMPAYRLNNVPIAMFLATHFYFSSYHLFSNMLLRKIVTSYQEGTRRTVLFVSVVVVFSYFTAFMETLSISSFPYYSFEDRDMAYTVGSAFYGIYFSVSFPAFFYFDSEVDKANNNSSKVTIWDTFVSSCGYGMMILTLLDFVRLYLDIPLVVGAPPFAS
jgi:cycloeucalenol cycloisomerase